MRSGYVDTGRIHVSVSPDVKPQQRPRRRISRSMDSVRQFCNGALALWSLVIIPCVYRYANMAVFVEVARSSSAADICGLYNEDCDEDREDYEGCEGCGEDRDEEHEDRNED